MKRIPLLFLFALTSVAALWSIAPSQEPTNPDSIATRIGKKRGSFLTVLDFGAAGDGQTDDTAAIQAVIDAKAGSIRFPAGSYRITKPLVVDLDRVGYTAFVSDGAAALIMAGEGPAIRFTGTHAGTADPESVKPNVWDRQRMPLIENLAITGAHDLADGVEATGTMQLTLRGVHIRKCRHAVHLVQRNRNVLIDACHIYENSGIGVFLDNVDLHQTNISASHISYCRGGGVVSRGGNVRNLHIAGCDIEANMHQTSPPTANILLDCTGGSIAEVAITGCTIQHTHAAKGCANIRFLGRGQMKRQGNTIEINCGHLTIGDNVLSDVETNIHLVGARGVTIVGNTFWKGHAHNLLVEASQHIVVGPNMMERNPLYGDLEAKNAVLFRDSNDCTITGLHLHHVLGGPSLTLDKCLRFALTSCHILDSEEAGILLLDSPHTVIGDYTFHDTRPNRTSTGLKEITNGKQIRP